MSRSEALKALEESLAKMIARRDELRAEIVRIEELRKELHDLDGAFGQGAIQRVIGEIQLLKEIAPFEKHPSVIRKDGTLVDNYKITRITPKRVYYRILPEKPHLGVSREMYDEGRRDWLDIDLEACRKAFLEWEKQQ